MFVVFAGLADADCKIGANWTPDPVGDTVITAQELWYNPDGVVDNGDEVMGATYDALASTGNFIVTGDCLVGQTIFIKTLYIGDISVNSAEMAPQDVVGAILSIAVEHTE